MLDRSKERDGYPAERARQGRIILTTPARRAIFFGALAAGVVLLAVVAIVVS